jgi:hypothetical protein
MGLVEFGEGGESVVSSREECDGSLGACSITREGS